jgi:hypothetical protein
LGNVSGLLQPPVYPCTNAAVNQIVDKRFDKRQSLRWTPRGLTCFCRAEHGSSTATSIKSFVAAIRR